MNIELLTVLFDEQLKILNELIVTVQGQEDRIRALEAVATKRISWGGQTYDTVQNLRLGRTPSVGEEVADTWGVSECDLDREDLQ